MQAQKLPQTIHISNEVPIDPTVPIYLSLFQKYLILEDSKLSQIEAEVLINRMILEHKLNNTAKEHLIALINCFMPKDKLL